MAIQEFITCMAMPFFFMGVLITFGDLQQRFKSKQDSFIKGLYLGVLVAILFFLKNSFGIGLLLICATYLIVADQAIAFILGVLTGILSIFCIFIVYFHGDLSSMIRDQYFVIQARLEEHPFSRPDFVEVFLRKTYLDNLYILFAALAACISMPILRKRVLLLSSSFLVLAYVFCASIMQWPEHVLSSFMAYMMICYLYQYRVLLDAQWSIKNSRWSTALMIISFIFALKLIIVSVVGLISDSPRLLLNTMPSFNIEKSRIITERAIDPLVLKNYKKGEKVILVGENNFLSYQFLQEPSKNDFLFWHNQVTFTPDLAQKNSHFLPERVFKDVALVVLSTKSHADTTTAFLDIYGDYIKNNFNLVDGNTQTLIYRIK